jgi:hypothetical protein
LVEEARRASGDRTRTRAAQESRVSLFADDCRRFADQIAAWPEDIRDYAIKLAFADLDPSEI